MTEQTLISEGKTKRILNSNEPGCIIMEYKDTMTAHDGEQKVEVPGLGALRTTQCSQFFMALDAAGLPTTFQGQLGTNQMLHTDCQESKLNLEFVVRTYAMPKGSYCKRHPNMLPYEKGTFPRRLPYVSEVFHKDSIVWDENGHTKLVNEREAVSHYSKTVRETDPLILVNPQTNEWDLYPQKQALLPLTQPSLTISPEIQNLTLCAGQKLAVQAYQVLEHLIDQLGHVLCDFKIELALIDDHFFITDSISLDEVRIGRGRDPRIGLDKQAYRDNTNNVTKVSDDYAEIAAALAEIDVTNMFTNW